MPSFDTNSRRVKVLQSISKLGGISGNMFVRQFNSGKALSDIPGMERWGRLREEDQEGPGDQWGEGGWREREVLSVEFSTRSAA